jgi:transcription antitermination factor NusG
MAWYVLYTKPRNEKKTATLLEDRGFEVYCPVQEVVKQWSDRRKKIQEPVFRSYVFVQLENYQKQQVDVLMTPGAVRFLWWLQRPGIVRDEEIVAIKTFLCEYGSTEISIIHHPGTQVMITAGPLIGQSGVVIKTSGSKAILQLSSLGWSITAQIPVQQLSAVA